MKVHNIDDFHCKLIGTTLLLLMEDFNFHPKFVKVNYYFKCMYLTHIMS